MWKSAGSPPDTSNQLYIDRLESKKSLRKFQRQKAALRRERDFETITSSLQVKSDKAFKTIRKHKSSVSSSSEILYVNNVLIDKPEDIMNTWTKHFESLATSSINHTYDSDYFDMICIELESILNIHDLYIT